ncbi:hypothetical protein PNIG_a0205 [Pseudoalteromonas nigrifaciens]|uniref:Aconitase B HEAT-like domain-containing protein n=1 Tax=Pseudoalteromonas nigrifaciens TaxID=28109 RepID=A0AAC9UF31_9GAMM|nr:hypothetical protein [Pseudoalteromonas nigrifaciens]ASM52542.1 hypothetical protein PNIG_a0205 [Pseudoalteromonas nigrifaciens]
MKRYRILSRHQEGNIVLQEYRKHVEERAALGIVPAPLDAQQTADLIELIKTPPAGEEEFILDLFANRVPAGASAIRCSANG